MLPPHPGPLPQILSDVGEREPDRSTIENVARGADQRARREREARLLPSRKTHSARQEPRPPGNAVAIAPTAPDTTCHLSLMCPLNVDVWRDAGVEDLGADELRLVG